MITRQKVVNIITNWIIDSEEYKAASRLNKDLKAFIETQANQLLTPEEKNWIEKYGEGFYKKQSNNPQNFFEKLKVDEDIKKQIVSSYYGLCRRHKQCTTSGRYTEVYSFSRFTSSNLILPENLLTIEIDRKTPIMVDWNDWEDFSKKHEAIANRIEELYGELLKVSLKLDRKITALLETLFHKDLSLRILKNNYIELYNLSKK